MDTDIMQEAGRGLGYAVLGQTTRNVDDSKPLEGLASIAEETERAAALISAFITRFRHGNPAPTAGGMNAIKPVSSGHAARSSACVMP
jgi:hypothetical protein